MIIIHFDTRHCPFHCIDIDHQHVSEQGHTRFRTGSLRQVHMSEPGLLLLVNYHEKDRYGSFWCQIFSRYSFDIPYHCKMTMFTNILATFTVEKQNIHNWINVMFRNRVQNSSSNRQHRVCSTSVSMSGEITWHLRHLLANLGWSYKYIIYGAYERLSLIGCD